MLFFWFRRDLRLEDNTGFYKALNAGKEVLPLFIFDSDILDSLAKRQDPRVDFIYQTVSNLQEQLEKLGSTLLVRYGKPVDVIKGLLQEYDVEGVYTNRDYEPYARKRDLDVEDLLQEQSLTFVTSKDTVIFERSNILSLSGTPYKVYTPYKKSWKKAFSTERASPVPSEKHLDKLFAHHPSTLPSLHQLGFEPAGIPTPDPSLANEVLRQYDQVRNLPALDATSRISPHLRFGTISVRKAVTLALEHSDTWLQELIWREFFMQLLYHFPASAQESFSAKFRHIDWRNNEQEFQRW